MKLVKTGQFSPSMCPVSGISENLVDFECTIGPEGSRVYLSTPVVQDAAKLIGFDRKYEKIIEEKDAQIEQLRADLAERDKELDAYALVESSINRRKPERFVD